MDLTDGRPIPVSGLLRAARALADVSQRALAQRTGLPRSVIARMETDETGQHTALGSFVRAVNACGFTVSIHADGRQLRPDDDPERDRGRRRYPPHLNPHPVDDSTIWMSLGRGYWVVRHMLNPPPRAYHLNPDYRERWRARLDHPWWARFWEDTAHLAPPHSVHPRLAARRRAEAGREEYIRRWVEKVTGNRPEGAARDAFARESESGAGDGGADEAGGDIAQTHPRGGERLREE